MRSGVTRRRDDDGDRVDDSDRVERALAQWPFDRMRFDVVRSGRAHFDG
jgi:hypothetical protein